MDLHQDHSDNTTQVPRRGRYQPIDVLRGFVIVLMALDHANHFIGHTHPPLEMWGGPFPSYSSGLTFLTRFVTHLAAPGFFFLMGTSMTLFTRARARTGWTRREIMRHYWIRGGLLIALQLLIVNRAWELYPEPFPNVYVGVLIALGGTMVIASFLLWVPTRFLLFLAIALVLGTEFIHPHPAMWPSTQFDLFDLILLHPGGDARIWSNYPILPWLELVVIGLVYGRWIGSGASSVFKKSGIIGAAALLTSIGIRWLNSFGNVRPMSGTDWIAFLNFVKYPPSLSFTLFTVGVLLILLSAFEKLPDKLPSGFKPLLVFGQAPLFFYVLHLFLYALPGRFFTPAGADYGVMILFWLLGLAILYPLCLQFVRLQSNTSERSLLRAI